MRKEISSYLLITVLSISVFVYPNGGFQNETEICGPVDGRHGCGETNFLMPPTSVVKNASTFADPPNNARLMPRPDLYYDKFWRRSYWRITWNVNGSSIRVEIDNSTNKVIYFHDFVRYASGDLERLNVSSGEALQIALNFINEKAVTGFIDPLPGDAKYEGAFTHNFTNALK